MVTENRWQFARLHTMESCPSHISNIMTAKEYILSRINELAAPIVADDIGSEKLEDAIYAKVMSKKFRKLKPGKECVELTRKAIELCVKEGKPITIFQLFGGNKLWRFDEAPEVDWAELFSFIYFIQWCRLIASVNKPGVHYVYFSQDISVQSLNNLPRSETDRYSESFKAMLKWLEPYLPSNIKVSYERHYDLFENSDDYSKEIEEAKKLVLASNDGKLPTLDDKQRAATELNVRLKPGQDDDPQWREKVELEHQAIFKTKTLQEPMNNPYKIWTCPTYYPDSVVTGSTKRSLAKFWAAVGALEKDSEGFHEVVLTPKQLAEAKFDWEDISIEGLTGKNFKKIRIIES